ncbi:AAA family ATPase [Polyangium aurulentum]|uniref:AAA family ATPase n=1 Tax=Polyangium aurulentum TaxID=2567896 RepID=UPI00146A531F|nr:AAA family ATPase [Polyangium aurulentum]UQA55621.1 AAA family ATPase [Polyangium aurulentum]
MFHALEIERFRGFAKLSAEDLGRVNLIVGKNNTGKTSLLEAITLLANPGLIQSLPGLFRANAGFVDERFYRWLPKHDAAEAETVLSAQAQRETRRVVLVKGEAGNPAWPMLESAWQGKELALWCSKDLRRLDVHAVSVQHRSPDALVDAFAESVRAPEDERQMEALLNAVDPRIRSLRLDAVASKPFIVVDVGLRERIPLSQAGQGIYRLVAILSELLGNKPDICFIDEIENGIHHSALPTVWNGIAEVAARLDIQVFATTHSRECLIAAHEAFAARDPYDFRVIQLYRVGDAASGRTLDRRHIEAAIAGDIELR